MKRVNANRIWLREEFEDGFDLSNQRYAQKNAYKLSRITNMSVITALDLQACSTTVLLR